MGSVALNRLSREDAGLERRLDTLQRYATLVIHQARALADEDLDRFETLAEERAGVQEELDAGPPGSVEVRSAGMVERIATVRQALLAARQADRVIEDRLSDLRAQTVREIRAMGAREPQLRRYLEKEGVGAAGRPRINIRL